VLPRFLTPTEKRYAKKFPNREVGYFWHIDKEEVYHALLEKAIERNEALSVDEIRAYMGKEVFEKEVAYLKEWNALPKWIKNAD
jgi:hypothetical protein